MSMFDLLHDNAHADLDLLVKNDQRGDNFATARDVDFAFKTNEKVRAKDICEYINGKNFGKATVREEPDGLYWVISSVYMPITQHLLFSVSGFMVCLSRLFQVEYDGWGSVIQRSSDSLQPGS